MEPFRQKGSSIASWSNFIFKSVMRNDMIVWNIVEQRVLTYVLKQSKYNHVDMFNTTCAV